MIFRTVIFIWILKVIENIKKSVDDTIGVASWKSHARLMKIGEGKAIN